MNELRQHHESVEGDVFVRLRLSELEPMTDEQREAFLCGLGQVVAAVSVAGVPASGAGNDAEQTTQEKP